MARYKNGRSLLILVALYLFCLGALVLIYQSLSLVSMRTALERDALEKLKSLGETIKTQWKAEGIQTLGTYDLNRFTKAVGAERILLMTDNGTPLSDSSGAIFRKVEREKPALMILNASEERPQYRIIRDRFGERKGEILLPLKEGKRIMQITARLPSSENPDAELLLLMIKLFGWVGGSVLGYSFFRSAWKQAGTAGTLTEREARETGGGLLVNTFQGIIHQLKQKERALTELHEYILQSVTSGIVTFNQEGFVTTANKAAETILGIEGGTMLGTHCEALFGENSPIPNFLKEILDQKKEVIREACPVVRQNGTRKFLDFTTSALRDPSGKRIGTMIVLLDLTEIKRLQEQVDIKKRLETMGEISGWIAHEFRNNMGTIMGYASLLAKEFGAETTQQGMARAISRECEAMDRLITDLLAYGKKSILTMERMNLTSLIEEVLESLKPTASDVQFVIEMASCEIAADRTLMRQALFNMVQNGIEAMEGKGTFTIRLTHKEEESIEIKLSDTGRGIPADQINLIFLPFFTTRDKGNGLGLALVHKVILSHNGVISVESKKGVGTTFTITLPEGHINR